MRVWVDDFQPAPAGWIRAFSAAEAIELLEIGDVEEISLNYELGDGSTGYDVLLWIEDRVALHGFQPPRVAIHAQQRSSIEMMRSLILNIERKLHRSIR